MRYPGPVTFLLLACTARDPLVSAETALITDISVDTAPSSPTVLEVSFTTAESVTAWVEFGDDLAAQSLTSTGTQHTLAVLGSPPLHEVTLQIVAELDGEQHRSGAFSATTGQLLTGTPIPEVTVSDYEGPPGATLLAMIFGNPGYLVMMDLDGTVHWSVAEDPSGAREGVGLVPMVEEGYILYNAFTISENWAGGQIRRTTLAGEIVETIETEGAHHFFVRLPDGSLTWTALDVREHETYGAVVGDQLIRRSPDGTETTLFSTWDHLPVTQTETWAHEYYSEGSDWTHGNGLLFDEDRGSYLFSTAGADVLFEIDEDGGVLQLIGGQDAPLSDYTFEPPEATFHYPHGVSWSADDQLLMMSTEADLSRAIGFSVDEESGELEKTWSYGEALGVDVYALGGVRELPDGNLLVNWGSVGMVQIVSPEGDVLWEAKTPLENLFSEVWLLSSPYSRWQ